jgi:hypothetical protein
MPLQKLITVLISVALFSPSARCAALSADEILRKVDQAYRNLTTYQSEGTTESEMAWSAKMIENMNLKGTSTEIHTEISMPELNASDLRFTPPNDAIEKESLFSGFLGGK